MADLFVDIIERLKNGERKAQEDVYNLLSSKMFAVCLRYAPSYQEAQDLLHDGFVMLFSKIGQFAGRGSFEGWARRIFVTLALNYLRKKHPTVSISEPNSAVSAEKLSEEEPVEDSPYANISQQELFNIIMRLPMQYRLVFNMYAIENYSHKQIAEQLNISEATSRSNLTRARQQLQRLLAEYVKSSKSTSYAAQR